MGRTRDDDLHTSYIRPTIRVSNLVSMSSSTWGFARVARRHGDFTRTAPKKKKKTKCHSRVYNSFEIISRRVRFYARKPNNFFFFFVKQLYFICIHYVGHHTDKSLIYMQLLHISID